MTGEEVEVGEQNGERREAWRDAVARRGAFPLNLIGKYCRSLQIIQTTQTSQTVAHRIAARTMQRTRLLTIDNLEEHTVTGLFKMDPTEPVRPTTSADEQKPEGDQGKRRESFSSQTSQTAKE